MLNSIERQVIIPEMHRTSDGSVMETYGGRKEVKVYGGHHPRTTIDIHDFNTHIIINKFGPFEFNKIGEVDDVLVRKGHHKSKFAIAFVDKKDGGPYDYDVWSSEGKIGQASGKRLDLLIASLFYDDPELNTLIQDANMDDQVKRHLKFVIITAGNRMVRTS
nr:hypothetical protein [Candidatus Levybacteria bacterium]